MKKSDKPAVTPTQLFPLAEYAHETLEVQLERVRATVRNGRGTAEDWEKGATVYDGLEQPRAASMFRAVAASMRTEGKRYCLLYPDNQEHIEEMPTGITGDAPMIPLRS